MMEKKVPLVPPVEGESKLHAHDAGSLWHGKG